MYSSSNQSDNQNFKTTLPPPSAPPPPPSAPPPPPFVHQVHLREGQETSWSTGVCHFGSCDVSIYCITCWCPCITFGLISEIVDEGSSSCVVNGGIYALLAYCTGGPWIISCIYRSKMRQQYRLKGSPCGDCCVHFWCETCALRQEYRELQNHGFNVMIGWKANMKRQNQGVVTAPVVQAGMHR